MRQEARTHQATHRVQAGHKAALGEMHGRLSEEYGMESIACAPDGPATRSGKGPTKLRPDPAVDSACLLYLETHFMHTSWRIATSQGGRRHATSRGAAAT